jgi:DNA processing protein
MTFGLGPTKARKLIEHFGYAEAERAREEMARAAAAGVTALSPEHACYPSRLQEIYDLPFVLYVRGNPEVLTQPGIAMVGTRHPTPHGLGMADRLACDLAVQGLVINQRHGRRRRPLPVIAGAIAAKSKTVALFGTRVDIIYPKENSRLSEQILALGGALISAFGMGAFAAPQNFPIRNRI